MERLTEYDYLAGIKTGDLKAGVDERKAFDRLSAYEDTRLEPEEMLCSYNGYTAFEWRGQEAGEERG